jgi:hypothetical protein
MVDFDQPTNELERALAGVCDAGEDTDGKARREVLRCLALYPVVIILNQPVTVNSPLDMRGEPAFVSNGEDMDQPMLALFSSVERAQRHVDEQGLDARYPTEVPGPRALLAVSDGVGVRINPNQELGFVILPSLAERLRDDIKEALERHQDHTPDGQKAPSA